LPIVTEFVEITVAHRSFSLAIHISMTVINFLELQFNCLL